MMGALFKMKWEYICPQFYQHLSDPAACYRHCREEGKGEAERDDTQKGLGLTTKKDFPEFVRCYCYAIEFPVTESDLPL